MKSKNSVKAAIFAVLLALAAFAVSCSATTNQSNQNNQSGQASQTNQPAQDTNVPTFKSLTYQIVTMGTPTANGSPSWTTTIESSKMFSKKVENTDSDCTSSDTLSNDDFISLANLIETANLGSYSLSCDEPIIGVTKYLKYVSSGGTENNITILCDPAKAVKDVIDEIENLKKKYSPNC